jgi:transcription elongation factor S-II
MSVKTETNTDTDIDIDASEPIDIMEVARAKCVDKINEIIDNHAIATNIEKGIYNYTIKTATEHGIIKLWEKKTFRRIYMNKCISVYLNLKPDSYIKNNTLKDKVLNNEIVAYKLAFMTPQELFPEHWKKLLDKKSAKDEFLYTKRPEAITDQFKCGKCKQRECTYYQLQLRSSDEPMTTFITCMNCKNKWHI